MESLGARNAVAPNVVKTLASKGSAKSAARGAAQVVRASKDDNRDNKKNTAVAGGGTMHFAERVIHRSAPLPPPFQDVMVYWPCLGRCGRLPNTEHLAVPTVWRCADLPKRK
jgi:hypothetical protein